MVSCAVCAREIDPEEIATVDVEFEHKGRYGYEREDYYLHARCAQRVFAGWQKEQ